ncbi:EamA-like transporter family protein [Leptospira ryugenii]|uniref:EamA-like transporter family protein n=1 Tax=Leptospira ryugenii TaxID=1917863 RepID=A0A2P2DZW4_9LEPT|nr:DMT family transporter [Leptospira ryugenii]GBF50163.1 EamA-like transporter family protein [Leptospira ryugenii]
MTGDHKKGYLYIFLTGLFFSIEVIGFKQVFRLYHLAPEIAAFYGVSISFHFVSPFFLAKKVNRARLLRTIQSDGLILLIGTSLNSIGILLYYYGLRISDLGPSALLIKMTVLYNVLLGVLLLGDRLRSFEVFGILLAIIGIVVISSLQGQIQFSSAVIMLISAFFFASQSYLIKRYIPKIDGICFAYLRLGILTLIFACYIISQNSWHEIPIPVALSLGLFSLFGFFLGRAFFFEAHNHLPISKLNAILLIEPVVLLFIGILFLGEAVSVQKFFGTFLIIGGLYLLIFHKQKSKNLSNQTK